MKILITILLLSYANMAQAIVFFFSGTITTAEISGQGNALASVGDGFSGFLQIIDDSPFVALFLPDTEGGIGSVNQLSLHKIKGGYSFSELNSLNPYASSLLGSDGAWGFTLLVPKYDQVPAFFGSGTFFAYGTDDAGFSQSYSGPFQGSVEVFSTPDNGTTLGLLLTILPCLLVLGSVDRQNQRTK